MKIFNIISVFLFFGMFSYPTYGNSEKLKIAKIEIKKYSQEVHVIVPFDCSKYDNEYQGMVVMKQPTIDTTIYERLLLEKIEHTLGNFNDFINNTEECRGNPQIQITIYYRGKTKAIFLIQDYYYLTNVKNKPVFKDEWCINFLRSVGGFR